MKLRLLLPFALLLTGAVQAQDVVPEYHYGMHLDVKKVLQLTEPQAQGCEVVKATMTYLDSAGRQQALLYRKLSEACRYEN